MITASWIGLGVVRNQAVKQDGVAAANALQHCYAGLNGPKIKTRSTPTERNETSRSHLLTQWNFRMA